MTGWGKTRAGDSDALTRAALEARLARAQEQFLATSDILTVLTSSMSNPDRVFDAVVGNARRLLGAAAAQIFLLSGDRYVVARSSGVTPEYARFVAEHPHRRDRGTLVGRVTIDRSRGAASRPVADAPPDVRGGRGRLPRG